MRPPKNASENSNDMPDSGKTAKIQTKPDSRMDKNDEGKGLVTRETMVISGGPRESVIALKESKNPIEKYDFVLAASASQTR